MSLIVEVSESGTLQLPTEILQAIQPHTRFVVEIERSLNPIPRSPRATLLGNCYARRKGRTINAVGTKPLGWS
ncbi:hypothetical protein QQ054_34745 [Oscillatoria amoena NRMC-F 0135]|nr:hypothetical protein [Geitlerinema splendidum]MDL5051161.1 hypothetical protein [Oscillatoria amoena NRMC-F 0135]